MPLAFPPFGTYSTPGGAITIAASTWRWDGVSGTVLVSSGFPLQPGHVTASNLNQMRVYVNSVEQAVALHPLDGTFPDGSYRSVGIQYSYTLTNNTPVSAEIRLNQGARGTGDLTWVEPTRATHVSKKAVIAPTSPTYLCGTMVTLTPLTPASNDTGTDATWAARAESTWLTNAGVRTGSVPGGASYDHPPGLMNLYCRTGNRVFYQWAYDWATEMKGSSICVSNEQEIVNYMMSPTAEHAGCGHQSTWNPEALDGSSGGSCGTMAEHWSMRMLSHAVMYWVTGWRQFKRNIAFYANRSLSNAAAGYPANRDYWIDPAYGVRFNFGTRSMNAILMGYLTGCTTSHDQYGFPGAPSTWDYATWLPWVLDALEYHIWNLSPGDYRNGLVGQRHGTLAAFGGDERYGVTNFQLTIAAEWLMVYYDHVKADPRVPTWIQTIGDYLIGQTRAQTVYDFSYPNAPYVSAYDNIPPASVAASTFTATLVSGNPVITYTGGAVPLVDLRPDIGVKGTGIPAGTNILSKSGSTITLTQNATVSGSQTVNLSFAGYTLTSMAAPVFAWLYAYTGNATYNTWAARFMTVTAIDDSSTKNWGENYGGTRQALLYYRHGGTIRGTPGAHPTVITNPPLQPTLG